MEYSDSTATSTDDPSESPDTDAGAEDQEEHETSALLPKGLMAGKDFKVGDEIVLKIDAMYDDEFEVSYATGKEDKKPEGSTMDKAKASMDRYAKEPGGM